MENIFLKERFMHFDKVLLRHCVFANLDSSFTWNVVNMTLDIYQSIRGIFLDSRILVHLK